MQKNCLPGINKKPLYGILYMYRIVKANHATAKPANAATKN